MKKLILFSLAIILTACTALQQSEFSRNREKWQQAGIDSYRFSLFVGCFCPFSEKMPLSIEVRNGQVTSMTGSDGTPVPESDPNFEFFTRYATIDRLFSELETQLNGGAEEVTVSYDPTYGYPAEVYLDMIKQAIDDELSLTVSDFAVLE